VLTVDQLDVDRLGPALRWAVARLAYRQLPRWATLALEMDSAGLDVSGIAHFFSRDLVQVPPALNDDLLDLFGRSEKILSNHFTFLNRARKFPEDIDWEPNESAAWRAELHSFDFGLDLALYFRISGEERYVRHLRYLIAQWIGANPPGQGSGWKLSALARRLRNCILSADLARHDWERDPSFFSLVTKSLALQATFLHRHAHSAGDSDDALNCAAGLQLAGKFFGGHKGNALRSAGRAMLQKEVNEFLSPAGDVVHPRPSSVLRLARALVDYFVFESCMAGACPGYPAGPTYGPVPHFHGGEDFEFWKERLGAVLNVLSGILLPQGELPLFGPAPSSSADDLADVFALAAALLGDSIWKNLAGKSGLLPYMLLGEPGHTQFQSLPDIRWRAATCHQPQLGIYRLSPTGTSGAVINGRLPRPRHDHQDALSYELSLCGQRVVIDSGAHLPPDASPTHSFAVARAHSVLLVDGQAPHYDAPYQKPCSGEPREAAGIVGLQLAHQGFSFLGVAHQRAWFCVNENAWVVLDCLEGSGAHGATSLIHFYPIFEIELRDDRAIVHSRSLALSVFPLGGSKPQLKSSRGDDPNFPGWYAPEFGVKYPASVLRLEWEPSPLPWLGGYLIAAGVDLDFEVGDADDRSLAFTLAGKEYRLHKSEIRK
jgi:hypothetical protein